MGKISRFGVSFIGYQAKIVGLKNNSREIEYATLDFVSRSAWLKADGCYAVARPRASRRLSPNCRSMSADCQSDSHVEETTRSSLSAAGMKSLSSPALKSIR